MDKIWHRKSSKLEVIGRCGGVEKRRSTELTMSNTKRKKKATKKWFVFHYLCDRVRHLWMIFSDFQISFISCVTDTREWRYFKQLYQIHSQIEEGLFNREAKSHCPEVFLRPKETVNIPFKYLMFKADHSVKPQVSKGANCCMRKKAHWKLSKHILHSNKIVNNDCLKLNTSVCPSTLRSSYC